MDSFVASGLPSPQAPRFRASCWSRCRASWSWSRRSSSVNAGCKGSWRVSLSLPSRAVFDLLEQGGATLRRQAEARLGAGRGDEETAGLMKSQAELVERTIGTLRQPAAIAKVENDTRQGPASAAAADPAADHGHRRRSTPYRGRDLDSSTCNGRRDHQHRRLPLASTSSPLQLSILAPDSSPLHSSQKEQRMMTSPETSAAVAPWATGSRRATQRLSSGSRPGRLASALERAARHADVADNVVRSPACSRHRIRTHF
jgi:hypothetical protein